MRHIKQFRPSPAMIVALLALVVSSAGTATAASVLVKRSSQLGKNVVTSKKVKDRSLLARDFKAGQLPRGATGPAGPAGATGPAGARGPQGLRGSQGAAGATNVTIHREILSVANGGWASRNMFCSEGSRATGGGASAMDTGSTLDVVTQSAPIGPGGSVPTTNHGDVARGWYAGYKNNSGATKDIAYFIVCAAP